MRKYNYEEIKQEMEKRKSNNTKLQMIYERVLKCANENSISRIDKRVLDLFKDYFTDTNFDLYYHNENEVWKQEKFIRIYYNNNYNDYVDITLFYASKISNTIEKTIEDLKQSCIDSIEYQKEQETKINNGLNDLENKVNEFNNLMNKIEEWQKDNEELHYLMQVKEY